MGGLGNRCECFLSKLACLGLLDLGLERFEHGVGYGWVVCVLLFALLAPLIRRHRMLYNCARSADFKDILESGLSASASDSSASRHSSLSMVARTLFEMRSTQKEYT